MTDTDMLYMAALEKRLETAEAENTELKARVAELEDKHWNECRQIAHYDDELRNQNDAAYVRKSDVLDLITEAHEGGSFTDYSDYSSLWDAVDDMPGKENVDNDT